MGLLSGKIRETKNNNRRKLEQKLQQNSREVWSVIKDSNHPIEEKLLGTEPVTWICSSTDLILQSMLSSYWLNCGEPAVHSHTTLSPFLSLLHLRLQWKTRHLSATHHFHVRPRSETLYSGKYAWPERLSPSTSTHCNSSTLLISLNTEGDLNFYIK